MPGLRRPPYFGLPAASKDAHTVAAPLLAAASLSLAGVVAGAPNQFRLPGPTLLVLVTSSLLLIASIQFFYHSRRYLYSRAEIDDWLPPKFADEKPDEYQELLTKQGDDYDRWLTFHNPAVHCFNLGTLVLGLGMTLALWPGQGHEQATWRIVAAWMVAVALAADALWVLYLYVKAHRESAPKAREEKSKSTEEKKWSSST
jgi:hypothetical protein